MANSLFGGLIHSVSPWETSVCMKSDPPRESSTRKTVISYAVRASGGLMSEYWFLIRLSGPSILTVIFDPGENTGKSSWSTGVKRNRRICSATSSTSSTRTLMAFLGGFMDPLLRLQAFRLEFLRIGRAHV